jgi:hypothetical protein
LNGPSGYRTLAEVVGHQKGDLGFSMTSRYAGREGMEAKAACVAIPKVACELDRLAAYPSDRSTSAALCRRLVPLCEDGWPPHKISVRRAAGADSLQDGGVDALAILGCLRLDQHRRTDRAAMY